MLAKFVILLIGMPLLALSLVFTIAILKAGRDTISKKKPPDSKSDSKKSTSDGKDA